MGAIVGAFSEVDEKRSPFSQFRVDPSGNLEAVSTHDQILAASCRDRESDRPGDELCSGLDDASPRST